MDVFHLSGSFTTDPTPGCSPSGAMSGGVPLDEYATLKAKHFDDIDLTVDTPVPVAFGGVVNAGVVFLKVEGAKVRARITSADGTQQCIPVDGVLMLISLAVPVTAIDLTRLPATATIVHVFLGEKA